MHPGLAKDFNGVDVTQAKTRVKPSCSNHIKRMMTSHGWETSSSKDNPNTASPPQMDVLDQLSKHMDGPKESTQEHMRLENQQ